MKQDTVSTLSAGGVGRTVDVLGARVFVAERGSADPSRPLVVALHAIAHGSGDFEPLVERLGDRYRFALVDWPEHGLSRVTGGAPFAPSVSSYAQLLAALLPKLTDRPAILLGNSIGGGAAIAVAAAHPELVRALVLCNSSSLLAVNAFTRFAVRAMTWFFRRGAAGARWFAAAYRRYYGLVLPLAPARRAQIIAAGPALAATLAAAWASFGEPSTDLRALVPSVRAPTWIAWAKRDRVIPWARSRAAGRAFPSVKVDLLDGGHSAFMEDPDAFAAKFAAFVDTLP